MATLRRRYAQLLLRLPVHSDAASEHRLRAIRAEGKGRRMCALLAQLRPFAGQLLQENSGWSFTKAGWLLVGDD